MLTFKCMQGHDICDLMFILKYFLSNCYNCVKRHLLVYMTLQNALGVMDNKYGFVSIFVYYETWNFIISQTKQVPTILQCVSLGQRDKIWFIFPSTWHNAWHTVRAQCPLAERCKWYPIALERGLLSMDLGKYVDWLIYNHSMSCLPHLIP